jgi:hypothetical protein
MVYSWAAKLLIVAGAFFMLVATLLGPKSSVL